MVAGMGIERERSRTYSTTLQESPELANRIIQAIENAERMLDTNANTQMKALVIRERMVALANHIAEARPWGNRADKVKIDTISDPLYAAEISMEYPFAVLQTIPGAELVKLQERASALAERAFLQSNVLPDMEMNGGGGFF